MSASIAAKLPRIKGRMTIAEYRQTVAKPSKYRNVKTEVDGRKFDSKLEARRYLQLKRWRESGAIRWFTMQVPFPLPGGITYRADFVVVWECGCDYSKVTVEDCKGFRSRVSTNKIKQVEEIYGLKIEIITKERYR